MCTAYRIVSACAQYCVMLQSAWAHLIGHIDCGLGTGKAFCGTPIHLKVQICQSSNTRAGIYGSANPFCPPRAAHVPIVLVVMAAAKLICWTWLTRGQSQLVKAGHALPLTSWKPLCILRQVLHIAQSLAWNTLLEFCSLVWAPKAKTTHLLTWATIWLTCLRVLLHIRIAHVAINKTLVHIP